MLPWVGAAQTVEHDAGILRRNTVVGFCVGRFGGDAAEDLVGRTLGGSTVVADHATAQDDDPVSDMHGFARIGIQQNDRETFSAELMQKTLHFQSFFSRKALADLPADQHACAAEEGATDREFKLLAHR